MILAKSCSSCSLQQNIFYDGCIAMPARFGCSKLSMKLLIYSKLREKQIYDTTAVKIFSFDCDQPKQITFKKREEEIIYL